MVGASDIGKWQIKQTRLKNRAWHYRRMATAILIGAQDTITDYPKSLPRGRSYEWYMQHADQDERTADTAGELASAFVDMAHVERVQQMSADEASRYIEERYLSTFTWVITPFLEDLPHLVGKLSSAQRAAYRAHVQALFDRMIAAL